MVIKSIIRPLTLASLLATLLYTPPELLEQYLGSKFAHSTWPTIIKPIIKTLVGLGIVKTLNRSLNVWATNNWRISSSPPQGRWDWPNEIAVVTGGCSGIGLALVEGLTAKGIRTAVLDINEPPPSLQANPKALFFSCDVSSLNSVVQAAEAVRKEMDGEPSILINNAGIFRINKILDATDRDLQKSAGVNMLALWYTTQQFVPAMVRRNKGHVVTLASLASYISLTASVEYSATKAAALAFHEGLACELKHIYEAPGVVTSVVHPNFVRTPMTEPIRAHIEKAEKMLTIQDVVDPVLRHIYSGRGGQLIVPQKLSYLTSLRGWPNWLQEIVRDGYGKRAVQLFHRN